MENPVNRLASSHHLGPLALILTTALLSSDCTSQPAQKERCVFIDAGAHFGESYTAFQKSGLYSKYTWELFAIEANPGLASKLPEAPNLTVISKAIWVSEGTIDFHMLSETSGANTVLPLDAEKKRVISVESFDFSQWLKDNFSEDDRVFLSMDIEGAEYQVLQKVLEDKAHRLIDRLYVEVHPWLLKDMPLNKAEAECRWLLNEFRRRGVAVVEDSAEGAMKGGRWLDFLL